MIFFFQAEDGIRDLTVTEFRRVLFRSTVDAGTLAKAQAMVIDLLLDGTHLAVFQLALHEPPEPTPAPARSPAARNPRPLRSEERRVGKECRSWLSSCHYEKKRECATTG